MNSYRINDRSGNLNIMLCCRSSRPIFIQVKYYNSDHIASGAWQIFNKLRRTWKEGGMVEFHVEAQNLPGGAEKNKKFVWLSSLPPGI